MWRYTVAASVLAALLLVAWSVLTPPAPKRIPAASPQPTPSHDATETIALPDTPLLRRRPSDSQTRQMKTEGLQSVISRVQDDTRMTLYADAPPRQTNVSPSSRPAVSKIILRVASQSAHHTLVVDAGRIADARAIVLLTDNGRSTKRFNVIAAINGTETYPDLQIIVPPSLRMTGF